MKFEVDRVRDGAHIIRIVDEDLINMPLPLAQAVAA